MPFLSPKFLYLLLGSLLLLNLGARAHRSNNYNTKAIKDTTSSPLNQLTKKIRPTGYQAINGFGDEFIAVGSAGRIDRISTSGKVLKTELIAGEDFNCVLTYNKKTVVAGDRGSIYISSDNGVFRKVNSDTDKNINTLALFHGIILAGTDEGTILSGDGKGSFRRTYLAVNGNIVSLSARKSDCYGVTDQGEIIHTTDGTNWDVFNFNEVYAGFYKPCSFSAILASDRQIAVAGVRDDGSPVLIFSNQGNVWSDRSLNYTDDQGVRVYPEDTPNGLFYDPERDLFFLACTNGKLMKIPSCSHCNKLAQVSTENFTGISGNDKTMMIVGENFYVQAISLDWE
jgi:hypothetical protein